MIFSRPSVQGLSYLILSLTALTTPVVGLVLPRGADGPCDIYANGGTPCVAAHSSTRALFGAYSGPLYQVIRNSDGQTIDINAVAPGGIADGGAQDSFCKGSTCLISILYDQSGTGNDLNQSQGGHFPGPQPNGWDDMSGAVGAPVTVGGQRVYGTFIHPGSGYRNNGAVKTAHGDGAEGMYAVIDGTHFNDGCCFDYGNAEIDGTDTGNGHMEAIYFGTNKVWGTGSGDGPWVMADLENGLFSGENPANNPQNPTISDRFLTAIVKGEPSHWAIRGGAASSGLTSFYDGATPDAEGYNPMSKEGAIILGVGGDNSKAAQGTFYEGVMVTGFPTDETENAVQANINSVGYATAPISGPSLSFDSTISLRVTTPGYDTRSIAHDGATVNTQTGGGANHNWVVRKGLAQSECYSFESVDSPGSFIRHYDFALQVNAQDGTKTFQEDATFCTEGGLGADATVALRSWSFPSRYFRHYANVVYIATQGRGFRDFDNPAHFIDDVSFVVGNAL